MHTLKIPHNQDEMIGAVRVSKEVGTKIKALAKKHNVSNQTIIRLLLERFINEVIFE